MKMSFLIREVREGNKSQYRTWWVIKMSTIKKIKFDIDEWAVNELALHDVYVYQDTNEIWFGQESISKFQRWLTDHEIKEVTIAQKTKQSYRVVVVDLGEQGNSNLYLIGYFTAQPPVAQYARGEFYD